LGAAEILNAGLICDVGVPPPVLSEQAVRAATSSTVGNATRRLKRHIMFRGNTLHDFFPLALVAG